MTIVRAQVGTSNGGYEESLGGLPWAAAVPLVTPKVFRVRERRRVGGNSRHRSPLRRGSAGCATPGSILRAGGQQNVTRGKLRPRSPAGFGVRRSGNCTRCPWAVRPPPISRNRSASRTAARRSLGPRPSACRLRPGSTGRAAGSSPPIHGLLGAGVGCVIGGHEAHKRDRERAEQGYGSSYNDRRHGYRDGYNDHGYGPHYDEGR